MKDPEAQLWELSRLDEEESEDAGSLPDPLLQSYRKGLLPEPEAEAVEIRLARDPAARARLRELAGLGSEAPPLKVREKVLAGFGKPASSPRSSAGRFRRWLPAAAALAASLFLAILWLQWPSGLPAGLAYDVTLRGAAGERSIDPAEAPAGGATVAPDTTVRLEVSPRGAAEGDVDFGLYRVREGRVERIPPGPALAVEVERGAARFRGLARDLVGPAPGSRDLFVVVARQGRLPRDQTLDAGDDPVRILSGRNGERRVYVETLRVEVK